MKYLIMLIMCGVLWGSQYEFNRLALESMPAIWIAALRSSFGALILIAACYWLKLKRTSGHWPMLFVIATLEATLPFLLVAWGQQSTPSSHAAVITGMNPLLTILLAPLFLRHARLEAKSLLCGLLGFASLLYLFYPQLHTPDGHSFYGAVAIFIAALSFALSLILVKKLDNLHPIVVARDVIVLSALQLLPIALLSSELTLSHISMSSALSSLYLGIFCGGVVYILFMQLIMSKGPAFASLSNYLVPTVGVILAAIAQGGTIDSRTLLSLAGILSAILLFQFWPNSAPSLRSRLDS
ncbi:EamA family transporter [Vibrio navarrensis]|uniref:DMT family transporter n=1 Tax=Vibrio navarrensis TaxID=29495 RepID=UPI001869F295|nr:DMT family transporter [Vibrio navarrensis]MBE4578653.1 EamA family transporter [Vibrio navarrensis]MBE4597380.1 EamA family transporter [Vibrio navarrensis]